MTTEDWEELLNQHEAKLGLVSHILFSMVGEAIANVDNHRVQN